MKMGMAAAKVAWDAAIEFDQQEGLGVSTEVSKCTTEAKEWTEATGAAALDSAADGIDGAYDRTRSDWGKLEELQDSNPL